jgi:hypothetical protein
VLQAALISVAFGDSAGQIVGTALAVALVLVAVGGALASRRPAGILDP